MSALRALDDIRHDQIVQTMQLHDPDLPATEFAVAADAIRAHFGIGEDDVVALEFYEIRRTGEDRAAYETWAYLGEAGMIFPAGSSDATPVYYQQGHFWSVDPDDADAKLLATALDAAAPF